MPPSVTLLPVTYDPNAFIDNIYTNLTRLEVGVESAESNLPVGSIILWYGSLPNVPAGWQVCDGTNGTPNMRGRVPVGVDSGQTEFDTMGETGGAKTHTLTTAEMPVHAHSASSGDHSQTHYHGLENHSHWVNGVGNHVHQVGGETGFVIGKSHGAAANGLVPNPIERMTFSDMWGAGAHDHGWTGGAANGGGWQGANQGHTHSVTVNNSGSGTAHNNLQPYLAIYFLMKVS